MRLCHIHVVLSLCHIHAALTCMYNLAEHENAPHGYPHGFYSLFVSSSMSIGSLYSSPSWLGSTAAHHGPINMC